MKQNTNFKIIDFNLKKGEVPLWTDIYCKKRNSLLNFLKSKNIQSKYYWKPLNTCVPYKSSFKNLSNSKKIQGKMMWLPSSLDMSNKEQKKICNLINLFLIKIK